MPWEELERVQKDIQKEERANVFESEEERERAGAVGGGQSENLEEKNKNEGERRSHHCHHSISALSKTPASPNLLELLRLPF